MCAFSTTSKQGFSIRFSPYKPHFLAVTAAENFGLSGNGALCVLSVNSLEHITCIASGHWTNTLFDVCWTPEHIVTSAGDGSIQIWNLQAHPVSVFPGHSQEVSSIDYEPNKCIILTASWDETIKLWGLDTTCISTFTGHQDVIHSANFAPQNPHIVASTSRDRTLRLWDVASGFCIGIVKAHDAEVLSCDWSRFNPHAIATSGSDSLVRTWDVRNLKSPVTQMKCGSEAVKQVKFSPHIPDVIATASFDSHTAIWNIKTKVLIEDFTHHTRVVHGVDWDSCEIGRLADCSWDNTVKIFQSNQIRFVANKF